MTSPLPTQPDWTKITVRPPATISREDFEKACEALRKANVKGPFVKLTSEGFIWND